MLVTHLPFNICEETENKAGENNDEKNQRFFSLIVLDFLLSTDEQTNGFVEH
jgi:hypothetical protein